MSKKTAAKRKAKKKKAKKNGGSVMKKVRHNVIHLRDKLQEVYGMVNLETTCCRQGVCCLVACPQMNYSEAMQILDRVWAEWDNDDKRKLIMQCLRFYFSNSMVKSCPLLGKDDSGNFGCRVYDDRPLMCRLYGMWPQATYERRVKMFENATGFDRADLPLNTQCTHVRRVDDSVELNDEVIEGLTSSLDLIDAKVGNYTPEQIDDRANYMTIHDWVLQKFFGDENMAVLTDFMLAATREEIDDYLQAQETLIMNMTI
jgi:Fe-S-cluster containining protein